MLSILITTASSLFFPPNSITDLSTFTMTSSLPRLTTTLLATAIVLALTACGDKDDKKVATQVAAKVDSEEISVHQINQVLSRTNTNGASPQAVQAMGREVLEKLIDQQLAVDQATDAKLHRSPDVVTQLEAARRDILARAYIQQITSALPKPTIEEAKKYFVEHPQLFSERRIFNVQELLAAPTPGTADQLRAFASAGKSMEEIAAWLKSKDIQFNGGAATRAAEQIPLEMLPKMAAMKDGQVSVTESAQGVTVLRLVSSQAQPVPEAAALPRIEQFLTNQRAGEAVAANIKKLRSEAKIAYMGDFTKPDSAAPAAAPTAAASPTANADKEKSAIEKGVQGLK
jgi:EpsD family peptidyl-prolyl cis-trans isomerase